MMIAWLDEAINDLKSLRHYIEKENPTAASSVVEKIIHSIELLIEQPAMGRPGRIANTRELIISNLPYIVPYRIKNQRLEILRVYHGAMQWPEKL